MIFDFLEVRVLRCKPLDLFLRGKSVQISEDGVALDFAGILHADTEWLNLADLVQDAQKVRVPTREETAAQTQGDLQQDVAQDGAGAIDAQGRININLAGEETLQEIPGVGRVKAGRIIAYREENGDFTRIEEIRNVNGIGSAAFERMKDYITVGGP